MLYISMLMHSAAQRVAQRARDERGAALAEYGLLVALIAVVCIAAVTALGTGVAAKLQEVATAIAN